MKRLRRQGGIAIGSNVALGCSGNDFGNIFLITNGGSPNNPNTRLDQATISGSPRVFNGALIRRYDVFECRAISTSTVWPLAAPAAAT